MHFLIRLLCLTCATVSHYSKALVKCLSHLHISYTKISTLYTDTVMAEYQQCFPNSGNPHWNILKCTQNFGTHIPSHEEMQYVWWEGKVMYSVLFDEADVSVMQMFHRDWCSMIIPMERYIWSWPLPLLHHQLCVYNSADGWKDNCSLWAYFDHKWGSFHRDNIIKTRNLHSQSHDCPCELV